MAATLTSVPAEQTSIQFAKYADANLPDLLRVQVLSFLRLVWPDGFLGPHRFRNWTSHPSLQPLHLLYAAGEQLVSHLELVTATVRVNQVSYRVLSPTAVLTYPAFRGQGWSTRLNAAALQHIDQSDADVGVLTCSPQLVDFYTRAGWTLAHDASVVAGPDDASWVSDNVLLTRLLGPQSVRFLADLRHHPMRINEEW